MSNKPNPEHTKTDEKTNDQNKVDFLLAKQLEEQEEENTNENDLDYLLALSMEQQEIMEIEELFEDNNIETNKEISLITDSEIIELLKCGIDIESLINTYSITKEHIISLQKTIKPTNKNKKKRKRKRQKSHQNTENINQNNDNTNKTQNEQTNEFLKQFTNFVDNKHQKTNKKSKQKSNKKKKRKKHNKNKKNIKKSFCNVCTASFEAKDSFLNHLKKFPSHTIKNPSHWIGHRKIPKKSNCLINYKFGNNAIIHDKHLIYFYNIKKDCYKLIKTYNENDFWFSYNVSLFYNKKYSNNSFYLFIICINGNNDTIDMCNVVCITEEIDENNNEIVVECNEINTFINKVVNIDPAKGATIGVNNELLLIMAHSDIDINFEESDTQKQLKDGSAHMKFIVYNLESDIYCERMINLEINKNEIYSDVGGDYHLGIVGLDCNMFLIFNKDIMYKGMYNCELELSDDKCLKLEKIYNKIGFNEIVKYEGSVFWNFVYLRFDDYIFVFGGGNWGCDIENIVVFDINNNYWFKSRIKLPLPIGACNNNCFIDEHGYVHLMGGYSGVNNCTLACHYSIAMKNVILLRKDFDKLVCYWIKQSGINEFGWLIDLNLVIYKYYLF